MVEYLLRNGVKVEVTEEDVRVGEKTYQRDFCVGCGIEFHIPV